MRKIFLLVALILSLATPANAWESTIGLGWEHRHYSSEDQLGAASKSLGLSPRHSDGIRVSGSWLWPVGNVNLGPEISFGNGFLTVPYQSDYFTRTAGKIDTSSLSTQSVLLSAKIQVLDWRRHLMFLKPGVLVTNLTSGTDRVDADTGSFLGLEFADEMDEGNRFYVDMQAILSPTIRGKYSYDFSLGLVLGVQWIFRNKIDNQVLQPLKETTVKVPQQEQMKEVAKPTEYVPPPADSTPVIVLQPIVVKKQSAREGEKVKATLKLGQDGKLSPESYPLIQKILEVYGSKSSIVKILHKEAVESARLAEEIKAWLIEKGAAKEDVQLSASSELDKPIRISIVPKQVQPPTKN